MDRLVILFVSNEPREHDLFSMAVNCMGVKYTCFFAADHEDIIHHIKDHQPDIICFNSAVTLAADTGNALIEALNGISSTNIVPCENKTAIQQLNTLLKTEVICVESNHHVIHIIKTLQQVINKRFRHLKTIID